MVRLATWNAADFTVNVALAPVPPAVPLDLLPTMTTLVASLSVPYSVTGVAPWYVTASRYSPGLTRMYWRDDPVAAESAACTVVCEPLPSLATVKAGVIALIAPSTAVGDQLSVPFARYLATV